MKKFLAISLSIAAIFLGYRYGWRWYIGNSLPDSEITVIHVAAYDGSSSRYNASGIIGDIHGGNISPFRNAITRSSQMEEDFSLAEADYELEVFYDNHDVHRYFLWLPTSDSKAYLSWNKELGTYYQVNERDGENIELLIQSLKQESSEN